MRSAQQIEEALAARRRLNRALVRPELDPDSGRPRPPMRVGPPGSCPPRPAISPEEEASATVRGWLALPPTGPLPEPDPFGSDLRAPSGPPWHAAAGMRRALDLVTLGATQEEAALLLGVTPYAVNSLLRRAYLELDVHEAVAAAARWRALRVQLGWTMHAADRAAYLHLHPRRPAAQRVWPTQREAELLRAAAAGIPRARLGLEVGRAEGTVGNQLHSAYLRLGARNLLDAIDIYLEMLDGKGAP